MRVPKRRGELLRRTKQTQGDNYLSKKKIQRLKDELEDLEKNQRPEAVKEVQRTGEMGDFSENAAYQMAKGRLRRINSRITSLTERLKVAIPIEEGSPDGIIGIGSRIAVEVNGLEKEFEIVGSQEANPMRGKISIHSPLGKLLIGKIIGDHVELNVSERVVRYEIKTVA